MLNEKSIYKFQEALAPNVNRDIQHFYIDAAPCKNIYQSFIFSIYLHYYNDVNSKLKEIENYIQEYVLQTDHTIQAYIQKKLFTAYFKVEDKVEEYEKLISSINDGEFKQKNTDIFNATDLNYIIVSTQYCDQKGFTYEQNIIRWKNIEEMKSKIKNIQIEIRSKILGDASCQPVSGSEGGPDSRTA